MSVREGQKRLRKLSKVLRSSKDLADEERLFLSAALNRIADGEDANTELGVKAKRGERKGKLTHDNEKRRVWALHWIAYAKLSVADGGLGLTLEEACAKIGENDLKPFGFTEETLRTYWKRGRSQVGPIYK